MRIWPRRVGEQVAVVPAQSVVASAPAVAPASAASAVDEQYRWQTARDGAIPAGAVPHGREADGQPLWVCRARWGGGLHPGKVRPGMPGAAIPFGGLEIVVAEYEVLMDAGYWVSARGGEAPVLAHAAGRDADGEVLYVARAGIGSGVHPGKVRPAFGAANIGYGNAEHKLDPYEVLTEPGAIGIAGAGFASRSSRPPLDGLTRSSLHPAAFPPTTRTPAGAAPTQSMPAGRPGGILGTVPPGLVTRRD